MEVTVRSDFDCPASDGAEKKPRNLALRGLKPPFQRVEETKGALVKRELTLAQSQNPCNRKSDYLQQKEFDNKAQFERND